MGKLTFKNEVADATTPPSGYVVFYAIGDALFWRDDAGTIHSIAAGTGDVKADGTVPLTANWDVGSFKITALQFESDIATGTAPLIVASTTAVTNLNADLLDGLEAAAMVLKADFNANTILYATTDDTPAALTIPEQTIVGRITAGAITALTATQVRTLINVESGADVTDATNVAAAGAVMDSDISAAEGFLRKTGAGTYEAIKSNLAAAVAPTANEDSGDGYAVGSRWIDTTADKEYVCLDATVAAAVWTETTGAGGGGADADAIHDNVAGEIALITEKVTPVDADLLVIEDSAAANAKKRAQIGNVRGLNQSEVDARVVAVAPTISTSRTYAVAFLDDTVWSYDFAATVAAANVIISGNHTSAEQRGIFAIRAGATPFCVAIASSGITATTGALTGTTGVDGAVTVSTHTDFKLYVENRRGFTVTLAITINSHINTD